MKDHDHIVYGCLLHDIGKFFERAEVLSDYRASEDKKQIYCKKKENGYSHYHVLNTVKFCELLSEKIPQISPEENQTSLRADQNWINLASLHHNPSERKEFYLEKVVQAADHLASAEREPGSFYEQGINKKSRLESLLGRVNIGEYARNNDYFLPLAQLTLSDSSYPFQACQSGMEEKANEQGKKVWLSKNSLVTSYQQMATQFLLELESLQTFQANIAKEKILKSTLRSLLSLMEQYLSQVPAATNVLHPDISLFDHLRITAAIGESLYLYHQNFQDAKGFDDKNTPKWQLVCGDFSGIQKFIYKITNKGAAKGLRGRSFFIQLLCDGVAEHMIRTLGLYATARIYSSGGKFYLLIPTHLAEPLKKIADAINQDLLTQFQGEIFLGIGMSPINGDDFREGNMGAKWKAVNEDLQNHRMQPFKSQVSEDISCFAQQTTYQACRICGRDDSGAQINSEQSCKQCQDLERIGAVLADSRYLFWVWGDDRNIVRNKQLKSLHKTTLPGIECDLYFLETEPELSELTDLSASHLEVINDWPGLKQNRQGYSQGFRYVGKWLKDKESGKWEFDGFAKNSQGINRLGVLRMDVDNLGEIFIRGLRFGNDNKKESMGSLSRVATLSRQLHWFFAGYLHHILAGFPQSQVIYAGGDDVFIVGSWHELPDLARSISLEFKRYCANNPQFTLSAGIIAVGGKYPISRAAQLAGDAEEQAKGLNRGKLQKDALCFLETSIGWESYDDAVKLRDTLIEITQKTNSQAIIDRLRQVVIAVQEIEQQQQKGKIDEFIYWEKWRWRLVYNIKRMEKRYPDVSKELNALLQQLITPQHLTDKQIVMDWLQLPVRWSEFLLRSKLND